MYPELQTIRLRFPILHRGIIPVDHGEALYAALSRKVPVLHNHPQVGISAIYGSTAVGDLLILDQKSGFFIQCLPEMLSQLLRISGTVLELNGKKLRIGIPQVVPIVPAETLVARFVTVRGKVTEDDLLSYLTDYIQALHQSTSPSCEIRILRRRIVRVHSKRLVGFGVKVARITSPELSVAIQTNPPGGRRRYGGSFFLPVLNKLTDYEFPAQEGSGWNEVLAE